MSTREKGQIPAPLLEEAFEIFRDHGTDKALDFLAIEGYPRSFEAFKALRIRRGFKSHRKGGPAGSQYWDDVEVNILEEFYSNADADWLCEKLNRPWDKIQAKAKLMRLRRMPPRSPFDPITIPALDCPDGILLLPDLHVPYHDYKWIDRVAALAEAWQIPRIGLPGDVFDAQSLSSFEVFDRPTMPDEQESWYGLQTWLLERFARIDWGLGNHELRAARAVKYKFGGLDSMVRDLFTRGDKRVTVHNSYMFRVNGQWHIEHPDKHGMNAAMKVQQRHLMNTAIAHLHYSKEEIDSSGQYHVVTMGACVDPRLQPYCNRITFGSHAPVQGALILKQGPDGKLRHFNLRPDMDLESMRRMYAPYRRTRRP